MEKTRAYLTKLSKIRKEERMVEKLKRGFQRQMKIATTLGAFNLVLKAKKCFKTMENTLKYIEEMKRMEREKMKTCTCPICLEDMKSIVVVLTCGHIFHKECHSEWAKMNSACAVCRTTTHQLPNELCKDCSVAAMNLPHVAIMDALNDDFPYSFSCNNKFT